jgi:hypothetical protein
MRATRWHGSLAEIEADHFAQVGWRVGLWGTFDAAGLHAFIVARLGNAPPIPDQRQLVKDIRSA